MNEVNVLECTDRLADERSEGALPNRRCNMNKVNVLECTDRLAAEQSKGALPKGGATLWTYLA
ncbi:MAG: hypothetical protein U0M14_05010 [Eubacterium ventriosum]|nr:hypothetical protein [Eubacterium ventriosum]